MGVEILNFSVHRPHSQNNTTTRERELFRRVVDGDEDAFRKLYDQIHKKVFYYLHRLLREQEAAEDIMVETFTEAWRCAGKYRGDSSVRTWIFGIARNLAMNEMRRRKIHMSLEEHPHLTDGGMPDMAAYDRKKVIKDSLSRISDKHREVLDLVFFHEMNYQEVSEVLGIPVNTVKTRVFHAKDAMRRTMAAAGVNGNDL
jgi:RNA polymerase sigma-70 factor (ECF subfamily)